MCDLLARLRTVTLWALAAAPLAACGDNPVLPPAQVPVTEQQITISALTGTDVRTPSAYNMLILIEVRTDETTEFDFAFDIGIDSVLGVGTTGDTVAVLLPRGALGFAADGGLQTTTVPFDSIVMGLLNGYERGRPVRIREGDAVMAASRIQQCTFQVVRPRVAKLRIDQIDLVQRRAVIRVVINPNCGYLSLRPGIPRE